MNSALAAYRTIGAHGGVQDADPHRLVQMLFHGGLDRIHAARGCIERGDLGGKVHQVTRALNIIGGLQGAVNPDAGEIAERLDALYDYLGLRLLQFNARNDVAILDEVATLLQQISDAWDLAADEIRRARPGAAPR